LPKVDFKQPTLAPPVPFWATLRSLARIALFRSLPLSWSLRLCSQTRRFEFRDHPSRKQRLAALLKCVAPDGIGEREFEWLLLLSRGTRRLGSTTYAPVFRRSREWLIRTLRPEGLEVLDDVKRSGRGAIILGTHAGMNGWVGPTLTRLGYPVRFMQRQATTEETLLLLRMDGWVERVLPYPAAGEEGVHLKRLHDLVRRGEWIQHAADAADWRSGVEGRFLGHKVRCCRAPWVLGRLTGAPLVPVLLLADEHLRVHMSVERPLYVSDGATAGQSVEATFQAYLDVIGNRLASVPWNLSLLFDWEGLLLRPPQGAQAAAPRGPD
jgi:lauroyl/myristoyl acyltransferase